MNWPNFDSNDGNENALSPGQRITRIVGAVVGTLLLYLAFYLLTDSNIASGLRHLIISVLTLLVLGVAYNIYQYYKKCDEGVMDFGEMPDFGGDQEEIKKEEKRRCDARAAEIRARDSRSLGPALGLLVLAMFILFLTNSMAPEDEGPAMKGAGTEVRVLSVGTTAFYLKKGESTPWLAFPAGQYGYAVSSPAYSYVIIFSDGTEYEGDENAIIPGKTNPVFRVVAKSDETVLVRVQEI